MKLSVSVLSAIASSTSASSFIGEYATTTRYTQRSVEKTCSPQIPDLGQSNTCGEGTFDHESTCDITCDATGVTIEQTCSCYTSWGPIMMPRPNCVWEGQKHSNCAANEDSQPNVPAEHSRGLEDFANVPPAKFTVVASTTTAPPVGGNCPDLGAISFGLWKCKGQTENGIENGGMCAAVCNDGFKFGFPNAKYGVYHCQCVDGGNDCRWKQPAGLIEKAKKMKPDLVTAVSSLAWDTSVIFGESIIPTCSFIEHKPDKVCSKVPDIENGFFRCSKGHANGSGCVLTCDQGFVASGYKGARPKVKCSVRKGGWSQSLENMSCIANADAIEDDLSIVDNSFCPSAHDQFDVIPSLTFLSEFEYSNDAIDGLYPMGTKLMINQCDHGWIPVKFGGKGAAVCHCKRGNCKWKKFTASKFGCQPDIEFISQQDPNANVDQILSLMESGSLEAVGEMIESIFEGDGPRAIADHQSFIVEQAAEKSQAKKERFELLGLDMHGIGKGEAKKETIKAAWEKVRAERKQERKAERQAALLNAPKVCGDYDFDPATTHKPKCSGDSAGDFCNIRCKKSYSFDERKGQTSYCTCNKRNVCKWSDVPNCN